MKVAIFLFGEDAENIKLLKKKGYGTTYRAIVSKLVSEALKCLK